jgi:hypothetical protein
MSTKVLIAASILAVAFAGQAYPKAKGPGASGTSMFTHPASYAQLTSDPAGLFSPCGTVPQWPCLGERGNRLQGLVGSTAGR